MMSEQLAMPKRVYDRAYASVRFWADKLDPLKVTLALRLPPDHTHPDGEPRLRRLQRYSMRELNRMAHFSAHRAAPHI
jgi:hypothetical protein